MNPVKIIIPLFILFLFYNCSLVGRNPSRNTYEEIIDFLRSERPEGIRVGNIYKDMDMNIFRDFVDKTSIEELYAIHGKPDTIIDAYDVAAIDGYLIYEYGFSDGSIDCYVKKGEQTDNSLVDFIYYEPINNIKLFDFIHNDSVCSLIPQKESVVYYIGDDFGNILRIRLNKDNKNEIINIALNDLSSFREEIINISTWVDEKTEDLPISFGDFGTISNLSFSNKELRLTIIVDEDYDNNLDSIIKQQSNLYSILTTRLFSDYGVLRGIANNIIREEANLKLLLYGKNTCYRVDTILTTKDFKIILDNGASNIARLSNIISFDNLTYPLYINDNVVIDKLKIENNVLVLSFFIEEIDNHVINDSIESTIKSREKELLSDLDNPDREYFSLCARCNYGIKKVYYFDSTQKTIEVNYSLEEIKELLKML